MNKDLEKWCKKTEKLNLNNEIKLGQKVIDSNGNRGVVVEISPPRGIPSEENHGCISVWQSERYNYGMDNCEHYVYYGWKSWLRFIN